MIQYRRLEKHELTPELFQDFIRHQTVQDCYRKREGRWVIEPAPFIDDWSREEYDFLVQCLKDTIDGNGAVYGAFQAEALGLPGILKGFVSVEGGHMGSRGQYRDMTSLHVSEDLRGHGAGRQLFLLAKDWARDHGAEKLYISSHSAVETQRFYESMGCVDAEEVMEEHVRQEPYDRQLECPADGPGKTDRLLLAMIRYDAGDARRIQHLTKVYEYAGLMGRMERLKKEDQEILEAAAIVHDIGIHRSEEKYGRNTGRYQEIEGPPEAEKLLASQGWPETVIQRVSYLVGHHHTYTDIDGMDYQLLVEADFLVNLFEEGALPETREDVFRRIFRTESGKYPFQQIFSQKTE